jgi:hypothetical protein
LYPTGRQGGRGASDPQLLSDFMNRTPHPHCARRAPYGVALLAALAASFAAPPAAATRAVRATEVTVPSSGNAAFVDAMRLALVRLTGRRDADQDPAFAALLADPRRYAQIVRPSPAGGTQVTFDPAALERAVLAAGRGVWPRERPVALVVVAQPPPGADAGAVRASLEEASNERGLPVQLSSAASAGLVGEVTAEAALGAARRLGADVALVGRADDASRWSWTLYGPGAPQTFEGGASAGVHGAADALARTSEGVAAQPEAETRVRIDGVRSLRDYVQVARLLSATAGVRSVSVLEVDAAAATWRVLVRGGAEGLRTALGVNSQLEAGGVDGAGTPTFRYRP